MPPSSRYTFVVEIDGAQGKGEAERWAREIEQHLKGISLDVPGFEIAGLGQAKKDLDGIAKAAGQVGKALFKDADKQVDRLDTRLADVQRKLSGIISTGEQADWMEKFTSDVEQAATASGKMVTTIARWKQEMEKADNQVRTIQQTVNALGAQRLFPPESGLKLTVGEYQTIADLIEKKNQRLAQGKELSQADLQVLRQYEDTMATVVRLAEERTIEEGRAPADTWGPQAAHMQDMVLQYRKLREEQKRVEAESRTATKKLADAMSAKEFVLPAEAKGSLADFTRAMQVLGKATETSNAAITSQTRRLSSYQARLAQVTKTLETLGKAQAKHGVSFTEKQMDALLGVRVGAGTPAIGTGLQAEAERVAQQTQGTFERMRAAVAGVLQRLRRDQVGTFDPLTKEAEETSDEIVGGSIIPDMIRDILHWLGILKEKEDDVFAPLIKGAQYTQAQVEKAFQQMRFPAGATFGGKTVGGQFATKEQLEKFFSVVGLPPTKGPGSVAGYIDEQERFFREEIEQYQQTLQRTKQLADEQKKIFDRLGTTQADWAKKGGLDKFATAIQAAQSQAWGIRGFGSQVAGMGRGLQMAAGAAIGGATLAAREYLQLNEPLERAARNLELNRELTDELDASLQQMAGTASTLQATEQADMIFKWAAATGAQVESTAELNTILKESLTLQKMVKLGMVDTARAVEVVTDIQSQYGKSIEETEDIVAKLVTVAARSKAEVGDLGSAFSMVGAMADQTNVSFEETAAVLNILSAYGQRGSRAGTGLSRMLENLIAPADNVQKKLDEVLGAGALQNAEGKFIGIAAAIELIAEKTAKWTEFERQRFLSQITTANATRMLMPLIDMQIQARQRNISAIQAEQKILEGRVDDEVRAYIKMREETDGYTVSTKSALATLDDQWQQYTDSLTGRADMAKARWASMIDSIGKQVTTVALPELEKLLDGVGRLMDVAGSNPELVRAALQGTAVVAGIGALVTALGKGLTLYADVRMISAAAAMVAAAEQQVGAGALMVQAAGMQAGGAVAGAAGAAGGIPWGGLPSKRGLAIGTIAGAIGGEAFSQASTGKGLYDLFSVKEERWQAMFDAERETANLEKAELETMLTTLQEERLKLEQWYNSAVVLGAKVRTEAESTAAPATAAPEKYKAIGGVSAKLLEEDWVKVNAQIEAAQKRLEALAQAERVAVAKAQEYTDEAHRWVMVTSEEEKAFQAIIVRAQGVIPPLHEVVRLTDDARRGANAVAVAWDLVNKRFAAGYDLLRGVTNMANAAQDAMHRIPSMMELSERVGQEAGAGWDQLVGLTGMVDPATLGKWGDAYTRQLTALYMQMRGKEQWEIDLAVQAFKNSWDQRIQKVRDSAKSINTTQDDMAQKAKQAYEEWRSFAGGLLQPTQVTAEDMALTGVGGYEDKWDEWVRRIRAAQTDMTSEWRKMIPTDIEQAGQDAINRWAEQQINAFYAGLDPDKVNWDALIASYDQKLNEKMGKDRLLDIFLQKLQESGRTPDEYAAKQALGLESPLQQMFLGGMSAEQAGRQIQGTVTAAMAGVKIDTDAMTLPAQGMVSALTGAMQDEVNGQAWAGAIVTAFRSDITNRQQEIKDLGGMIGSFVFDGMRDDMKKYSIIDAIAKQVLDEIAEQIGPGKQST